MNVRDDIRLIQSDGWHLAAIRGSHRQYRHSSKRGRITIAGRATDQIGAGALGSVRKQAKLKGPR